jgi:hypothetical protein
LQNKTFTLKDILARIPDLGSLYQKTFREAPKNIQCSPIYWSTDLKCAQLEINIPETFGHKEELQEIVKYYREKFPFLNDWCLVGAEPDGDRSRIAFGNLDKNRVQEFSESYLYLDIIGLRFFHPLRNDLDVPRRDIKAIAAPLAGGLSNSKTYAIAPFDGVYLSDLSLYYLGVNLLSSLVRYRPQIWVHSISGLSTSQRPADNKALALIERFMELSLSVFPKAIVNAISVKGS